MPLKLIVVGTRDERLEFAKPYATSLVNVKQEDAYKKIMDLTDGKGADAVLQCATTDAAFNLAFDVAGKNARIIIEGFGDTKKGITMSNRRYVEFV